MNYTPNNLADRAGRSIGRRVKLGVSCAMRNWKLCLAAYACILIVGSTLLHSNLEAEPRAPLPSNLEAESRALLHSDLEAESRALLHSNKAESHPLDEAIAQSLVPRWGGFDERPMTDMCYRQERTAMILNFWLGIFGVDQFYAHHWALGVFKLFTLGGGGLWVVVDLHLWIVGGVYGTPGCPGGKGWHYRRHLDKLDKTAPLGIRDERVRFKRATTLRKRMESIKPILVRF